jgi:hypothetical protein
MTLKIKKKEQVKEETLAASSLHPAARPVTDDPKSKFEYIAKTIGAMHAMKDDELTKWYNDSVAMIGHEADAAPDSSESNKDSIAMKASAAEGHGRSGKDPMPTLDAKGNQPASELGKTEPEMRMAMPKLSVKEDVEAMFNGQDLSEEFKNNATTLFEAAVTARVILEKTKLEEEYDAVFTEAIGDVTKDITDKLDAYLDYAVDSWMKDNEVAIESAIRNELMEEFIVGLRALFVEHDISIPQEKVDALEAMAEQVTDLETKLSEAITENARIKDLLEEAALNEAFDEAAKDLSDSQREKFQALAEGVEFDGDFDAFVGKLSLIKGQYFGGAKKAPGKTNLEEETFIIPEKETSSGDPEIDRYLKAMDRVIKK